LKLIKLNFDSSLTFYREGFETLPSGGNYIRLFNVQMDGDDGRIEMDRRRFRKHFLFSIHTLFELKQRFNKNQRLTCLLMA
jgi:hypothetical protein